MKQNKPLWIVLTAFALVLLVVAATTVVPGLKISQYPLTTSPNANDLFILADVTVVPNTNRSYAFTSLTNTVRIIATNSVRIFAGTNVTVTGTNNGYIISVTNITGGTGGTATASLPLNSIQFNSNTMFAGDIRLMYTNGNVGIGTNNPQSLLSLHNTNITEPSVDISYNTGAGNTPAIRIRNGTGLTNMTMYVDGTLESATIFNSGSITGSSATVTALGVTGGTLGVGRVLTDAGGSGTATWQDPAASEVWTNNAGVIHPRVLNGQRTNSIQVWTNGGLTLGVNTIADYGPAQFGETIISGRNVDNGELDWNEIYLFIQSGTNLFFQDSFLSESINRRRVIMSQFGSDLEIDEYIDSDTNFVYRALYAGIYQWLFDPGGDIGGGARYFLNSKTPVDASDKLFALQNDSTNKFRVYGGAGNVDIAGQITNQFLTASKFVKTDANKGLVSSTLDEAGITNLVNSIRGTMTPGVTNVASAGVIVIDLANTNSPVVVLTNAPAHVTTMVVSNPSPGRWFSFYADGNGGITNNAIGWGGVDGLLLKWLDVSTNSIIVSNGFVSVAGYVAQTHTRTNLVITHRHE